MDECVISYSLAGFPGEFSRLVSCDAGGAALFGKLLRPVCRAPEEALEALVSVVQNNGRGRLYLRSLDPSDRLVLQTLPAIAIIEEPRAEPAATLEPLDRSKHIGIPH